MTQVEPTTMTHSTGEGPLLDRLLSRGWKFDFFQAVWLLERHCGNRVPVGERGPVEMESLRFRPDVSLGFPPSDIRSIRQRIDAVTGESTYHIDVSFLGLYGTSTPLPVHFAIDVLRSVEQYRPADSGDAEVTHGRSEQEEREESGSAPVRDFLDVFHNRLIAFFYRSWLKYRYDFSFGLPGRGAITDYLLWFIGSSPDADAATLGVSPIQMIRYAGLLTQRPRSATALEGVLSDYWTQVDVSVEQCVGRWVPLSTVDMNRIGMANSTFGMDLTVGEQVYDLSGAFNVAVGPMDWATYLSFLPDGSSFAETRSLVHLYLTDPLAFTIELKLKAAEIPEMRLGSDSQAGRLGFTSWVRTDDIPETSVTFSSTAVAPLSTESDERSTASEPVSMDAGAW